MPDPHRPLSAKPVHEAFGGRADKSEGNNDMKDIKAYYDAIASEPIPEEMRKLMAALAKAIRK